MRLGSEIPLQHPPVRCVFFCYLNPILLKTKRMKLRSLFAITAAAAFVAPIIAADAPKPLRVLIVAGGCCHDYDKQRHILAEGISARANVEVEIAYSPEKGTKPTFEVYNGPDWGKKFDVVIHDECAAGITDPAVVENILQAHRAGLPAVNLHCAMHCYRWGNFQQPVKVGDDNSHWYEMLGLQSTGHGPQEPIAISFVDKESPIVKGFADWTTMKEELYNNIQIISAHPLAKGKQIVHAKSKDKDGKEVITDKEVETVVAWTNEYGPNKTRTFSTTIGHNNATVEDPKYLDLVTRGLLWATGKLGEDGKPVAGYEAKTK
jgi:type 1 glutamine amidotransferase